MNIGTKFTPYGSGRKKVLSNPKLFFKQISSLLLKECLYEQITLALQPIKFHYRKELCIKI